MEDNGNHTPRKRLGGEQHARLESTLLPKALARAEPIHIGDTKPHVVLVDTGSPNPFHTVASATQCRTLRLQQAVAVAARSRKSGAADNQTYQPTHHKAAQPPRLGGRHGCRVKQGSTQGRSATRKRPQGSTSGAGRRGQAKEGYDACEEPGWLGTIAAFLQFTEPRKIYEIPFMTKIHGQRTAHAGGRVHRPYFCFWRSATSVVVAGFLFCFASQATQTRRPSSATERTARPSFPPTPPR